jgi:hypothetical protein
MTVNVRYFYQNTKTDKVREVMIDKLTNTVSELIELPQIIDVCLYKLDENVYGGIDQYVMNRLGLNNSLTLEELPQILVHELIHVHQRHTKQLEIKNNTYYWRGIPYHNVDTELTFEKYKNTPWEIDVQNRQTKVLERALDILTTNT